MIPGTSSGLVLSERLCWAEHSGNLQTLCPKPNSGRVDAGYAGVSTWSACVEF